MTLTNSMPEFETLLIDTQHENIVQLTLNRPERLNAINSVMMQELLSFWNLIAKEPNVRAIIVTGAGEKAFAAGADLKERQNLSKETWKNQHKVLQRAMRAMINCTRPIIAAVNGFALGGGLELALACDFIFANKSAQFGLPEVKLGIMPGAMGTQNLPRAVGFRKAKEMIYTGETLAAEEALSLGLVSRLYTKVNLLPKTIAVAKQISRNAPLSVAAAKRAINFSAAAPVVKPPSAENMSGYDFEIKQYNQLIHTQDRIEGVDAFNNKRTPEFKGE